MNIQSDGSVLSIVVCLNEVCVAQRHIISIRSFDAKAPKLLWHLLRMKKKNVMASSLGPKLFQDGGGSAISRRNLPHRDVNSALGRRQLPPSFPPSPPKPQRASRCLGPQHLITQFTLWLPSQLRETRGYKALEMREPPSEEKQRLAPWHGQIQSRAHPFT